MGWPRLRAGRVPPAEALAIDDRDRLYVADSGNHRIQVFDGGGNLLDMWGSRGTDLGQMAFPYDVAVTPDGFAYVCEYGNNRVQKFTKEGESLGTWGGPGREPGRLHSPWSLAVDRLGRVHVLDTENHRVQRILFKDNATP